MERGVVLDRHYCDDALALCFQEGLLTAEHDEVVGRLRRPEYRVSPDSKSALLENLMLSGRLVLPMRRYDWVHGEAIDSGLLTFSDPDKNRNDSELLYSSEFMLSFLRARGIDLSAEEIVSAATDALEALTKLETRFEELPALRNIEGVPFDEILRRSLWPEQPSKYSKEDLNDLRWLEAAWTKLRPIEHAIADLNTVEALANKTHAYRLVHLDKKHSNDTQNIMPKVFLDHDARVVDNSVLSNEIQVFRVACAELGAVPIRSTLRGSFELSQRSETKALRAQVSSWAEALTSLDVSKLGVISKDVASASKWLREAKDIATVSEIITYAGFPVAMLGVISPELTAAGIALSGFGALASAGVRITQTKFRWAMFGK